MNQFKVGDLVRPTKHIHQKGVWIFSTPSFETPLKRIPYKEFLLTIGEVINSYNFNPLLWWPQYNGYNRLPNICIELVNKK